MRRCAAGAGGGGRGGYPSRSTLRGSRHALEVWRVSPVVPVGARTSRPVRAPAGPGGAPRVQTGSPSRARGGGGYRPALTPAPRASYGVLARRRPRPRRARRLELDARQRRGRQRERDAPTEHRPGARAVPLSHQEQDASEPALARARTGQKCLPRTSWYRTRVYKTVSDCVVCTHTTSTCRRKMWHHGPRSAHVRILRCQGRTFEGSAQWAPCLRGGLRRGQPSS